MREKSLLLLQESPYTQGKREIDLFIQHRQILIQNYFYRYRGESSYHNDIAVLELAEKIRFDGFKRPAALALPSTVFTPERTRFMVTGWGNNKEDGESTRILRKVTVPFISKQDCRDNFEKSGYLDEYSMSLTESMICAGYIRKGGKDACQGDSGGPLVDFRKDQIEPIHVLNPKREQEVREEEEMELLANDNIENVIDDLKEINTTDKIKAGQRRRDSGYLYKTFDYETPEDIEAKREKSLGKFVKSLREKITKDSKDLLEKSNPLARFMWAPGTPDSPTRAALQSMINAGIEASILNALAHLQQMNRQKQILNEHQVEHQFDLGFLQTNYKKEAKFDVAKALKSFYEAFSDYRLVHRRRRVMRPVLPLVRKEYEKNGIPTLSGIVSWGFGCARPQLAGIYTDVRRFRPWIIRQIGGEPLWIVVG